MNNDAHINFWFPYQAAFVGGQPKWNFNSIKLDAESEERCMKILACKQRYLDNYGAFYPGKDVSHSPMDNYKNSVFYLSAADDPEMCKNAIGVQVWDPNYPNQFGGPGKWMNKHGWYTQTVAVPTCAELLNSVDYGHSLFKWSEYNAVVETCDDDTQNNLREYHKHGLGLGRYGRPLMVAAMPGDTITLQGEACLVHDSAIMPIPTNYAQHRSSFWKIDSGCYDMTQNGYLDFDEGSDCGRYCGRGECDNMPTDTWSTVGRSWRSNEMRHTDDAQNDPASTPTVARCDRFSNKCLGENTSIARTLPMNCIHAHPGCQI
jgi:hypothetical protein